jgi:transcriptional regulator with XRE-family HTH domain
MSQTDVDVLLLGDLIRSRRENEGLSLRDAAEEIGVSAPTLQRVETGQVPNTASLMRITSWLGVSLDDLRPGHKDRRSGPKTLAQIHVHLRADPNLDADAAEAIAEAVQKLYAAYAKQPRAK